LQAHRARAYHPGRHRHLTGRHPIFPGDRVSSAGAIGAGMLQIENLAVAYGRQEVIADLSVQGLSSGRVTALLGPNGSGKSTLLRARAGIVRTPRGKVILDGRELTSASLEHRARQ